MIYIIRFNCRKLDKKFWIYEVDEKTKNDILQFMKNRHKHNDNGDLCFQLITGEIRIISSEILKKYLTGITIKQKVGD